MALLRVLWEQRWVVVAGAIIALLLAGIYLWWTTPVYQSQIVLRPAYLQSLDKLNSTGLYDLDPEKALVQVGGELESYGNRLAFARAHPELFKSLPREGQSLEEGFEVFNARAFKMLYPNKKDFMHGTYVGLQLEYPAGVDGVAILNGLTQQVLNGMWQRTKEELGVLIDNRIAQLLRDIQVAKARYQVQVDAEIAKRQEEDATRRSVLEDELAALRLELKGRRENRMVVLEEAMRIAQALGINKPMTPSSLSRESGGGGGNVVRAEINNQQLPLYFMGVQALRAEREVLRARESDDFTEPRITEIEKELELLRNNRWVEALRARRDSELFIEDIGKMQSERVRLESLRIDLDDLQLVRMDQPAVQPARPVKPRQGLILALGLVLGGMAGVLVALLRSYLPRVGQAAAEPHAGSPLALQ